MTGAVAGAGLLLASTAFASDELGLLTFRIADPAPRGFDATALGRATHQFRVTMANPTKAALEVKPLVVRFVPTRDGTSFACDEPHVKDDRWPASLEAGGSFTFLREVACETPLPGRYLVEMRGRPRGAPAGEERSLGAFPVQIDPGPNPPVHLPWDASLFGAAAGTKDMRPARGPDAARLVIAMINGGKKDLVLGPVRVALRVTRRGYATPVCPERTVDLAFAGTLAPGRVQSRGLPLGCDIPAEAQYDVDVLVSGGASGERVRIATHPIRVRVNAPDSPGPQDWAATQFTGGS
ncbi:MAG: hypothetical protein JWP97_3223 [Labilithrix sp.]|nr:hypothetical protein [Labilithrix sp.]